jgi:lipopolysaccharide export system permease protein
VKRLDRYLVATVFWPFVGAQLVFLVMFIGTEALTEATKLISRFGLPWPQVIKMLLLRVPWALGWTMPMSIGMAVMLAIAGLCSTIEYTAILSGGMSFRRLMVPLVLFATVVSGFALWLEEYLGPRCMYEYHAAKIRLQSRSSKTQYNVMLPLTPVDAPRQVVLSARSLDPKLRVLEQPRIDVQETEKLPAARIVAKRARWLGERREWVLETAAVYRFDAEGRTQAAARFPAITVRQAAGVAGYGGAIVFEEDPSTVELAATDKPDYLTYSLIRQRITRMVAYRAPERDVNRIRIYVHRRWTLATSCLLFLLIGAPLAVRPERGATVGGTFAMGLAMVLIYYIIWNATSFLGEGSHYPWIWAWSTNVAGLLLGLVLFRRVPD